MDLVYEKSSLYILMSPYLPNLCLHIIYKLEKESVKFNHSDYIE